MPTANLDARVFVINPGNTTFVLTMRYAIQVRPSSKDLVRGDGLADDSDIKRLRLKGLKADREM